MSNLNYWSVLSSGPIAVVVYSPSKSVLTYQHRMSNEWSSLDSLHIFRCLAGHDAYSDYTTFGKETMVAVSAALRDLPSFRSAFADFNEQDYCQAHALAAIEEFVLDRGPL